jgi:RND family efflux transporter MFP subunit
MSRVDPRVQPQPARTGGPGSDLSALKIDRGAGSRRRGWLHRLLWRLFFLALLGGAGYSAWYWYEHAPLGVETAAVSSVYPSQALTLLNATGYVVAQRKAAVASKATGRLEWLGVLEGSKVEAGEVVARLENRDTQAMRDLAAANVLVAKANLGQGEADLAEAQLAFKRSDTLFAKELTSQSDHDSAVARLRKAQAALAGYQAAVTVAEANLRASDVSLDQTLIRAPFDGVVLTRNANVGDTITPFSQAVDTKGAVVTIADMDTLEVEADVAESSFLSIWVDQPVEIQLDAMPGERFAGVVSRMVPTLDRSKASMLVKIRFVQRDPRILPEMSARAAFLKREVTYAEQKPVLALPQSAVLKAADQPQVFTIVNGTAAIRAVELGDKLGDLVEVRGLEAGTRVVIRPSADLAAGRAVREEAN